MSTGAAAIESDAQERASGTCCTSVQAGFHGRDESGDREGVVLACA